MIELYNTVCQQCSELITKKYSTSFSLGIRLFSSELRSPIYAIYGFVRFADEIVDTFHNHNKAALLNEFRNDTHKAINQGISLNPVLHTFQQVVREYNIDLQHIDAFLDSMEMDLKDIHYDRGQYERYIYGSAEVVGLMCLKVFLKNNPDSYNQLQKSARDLGSAFQKINFLRDVNDDYYNKGRTYFPDVNIDNFSSEDKEIIEKDIEIDFKNGLVGITQLPKSAKFGVYIAYIFYYHLFKKIKNTSLDTILQKRVRIKNRKKAYLLAKYSLKNTLNLI